MKKSTGGWCVALVLTGAATVSCGSVGDVADGEYVDVDGDGEAGALEGLNEGEDELGSLESALRPGQTTTYNCSDLAQKAVVEQARNKVQHLLYDPVESQRFLSCLKNGTLSATVTYPEQLLEMLQENVPTTLTCDAGGPFHYDHPDFEDIYLNGSLDVDSLAEHLLHELVHAKGQNYLSAGRGAGHPGPEVIVTPAIYPCVDGCIERQMAAPIEASSCLFDNKANDWGLPTTLRDSTPYNIPLRTEMAASTGEVALSPVGTIDAMEAGAENHCAPNEWGVGIRGRATNYITSLGMVCSEGATGTNVLNARTGAAVGTGFSFACPAGEVLVGFTGRAGWWLDAIRPVCANAGSWPGGILFTHADISTYGGSGGTAFSRMCPIGHIVKGLRLRYNDNIMRMEVVCQNMGQRSDIRTVPLPILGAPSGGSMSAEEHCPSKSVMTKLWGVTEVETWLTDDTPRVVKQTTPVENKNKLLRLSAGCSKVSYVTPSQGAGSKIQIHTGTGNENHMLPFAGTWLVPESGPPASYGTPEHSGVGRTAACPAGKAFVGMKAYTFPSPNKKSVRAVRGLCADVGVWSTASTNDQWTAVGEIGNFGGTEISQQVCPAKHFLTGWRITEEPDVTNIGLRCRQF